MDGEVDNYDMEDDYNNLLEKPGLSGLNSSPSRNLPMVERLPQSHACVVLTAGATI